MQLNAAAPEVPIDFWALSPQAYLMQCPPTLHAATPMQDQEKKWCAATMLEKLTCQCCSPREEWWLLGTGTHAAVLLGMQALTLPSCMEHPPAILAALSLMHVPMPASGWTSQPRTCRSPSRNSGSLSQLRSFAEEHQSAANTLPEVSIRPGCQHLWQWLHVAHGRHTRWEE